MKRALLIGIDYKSDTNAKLNGCVDDVINIRNMLIDAYNYDAGNITILRDDIDDPSKLPTNQNIIQHLSSIVNESGNLSEIWIHYSGHGSQINDFASLKHNGIDQVIVPVDYMYTGFIADAQLLSIIREIKCHAMLVFDSCHSGTVCDLPWSFEYTSPTTYTRTMVDDVVIENPNIHMFSGCKDNQTSADTYSPLLKEAVGAFTFTFIETLRRLHYAIDILLLYREVCIKLEKDGYSQRPIFSSSSIEPKYRLKRPSMLEVEYLLNLRAEMEPFNLVGS